jgi:hypothetical protein
MQTHQYVVVGIVGIPIVLNTFCLVFIAGVAILIYVIRDYAHEAKRTGSWAPETQKPLEGGF